MCQYNEYCSFAHSDAEIKIELLHEMTKSQDFYDYKYKTIWCPYTNPYRSLYPGMTEATAPMPTTSRTTAGIPRKSNIP